jgi:N-acetylmuramoyl-L-alanine amidase
MAGKKLLILVIGYGLLVMGLSGCATVPIRETLPTYNINGTTYLPLVSLCNLKNINWEYDTFTRTIILTRDSHKINLMVGQRLVLVDGLPRYLKHPVDIYQGAIIIPLRFKEEVFDSLFKESPSLYKTPLLSSKIKKVIIDAGHGGIDPGAIGKSGLREKDVTLDVAKRLVKLLKSEGLEVVMTRSRDRFVLLSERVEITRRNNPDLFISIHANANRVRGLNGFEIYYISPNIDDLKRAMDTARNENLNLDKSCFASQSLDLKATLWDMIYNYNRAESIELARSICRAVDNNLNTRILGIKGANFFVLRGEYIPAVLIEIGFLSNHDEERLLKDGYYRQRIAEALAGGIANYGRELALTEAYP